MSITIGSTPKMSLSDDVKVWCTDIAAVFLLFLAVSSPIVGLIAVFIALEMFRRKRHRLGAVLLAAGVIVAVAAAKALADPGRLNWIYATFRDLNPFS
jgi:hypothetical protein